MIFSDGYNRLFLPLLIIKNTDPAISKRNIKAKKYSVSGGVITGSQIGLSEIILSFPSTLTQFSLLKLK